MKRTILNAETILCGPELEPMKHGCIIIEDGKIQEIMSQEARVQKQIPDAQEIELGSRTLMPGMIECHNHLNIDATLPDHLELLSWSSECELTLIALNDLKTDLMSGVTTARCLGDKFYIDVVLKKKIQEGTVAGPNLLSAGIGMKGLHGSGYIGSPHCGPEELRRTARENLKRNTDLLKLFVTPGMPPVGSSFIPSYLSLDEIRTVAEEGARLNIPTAAHCIGGQGLKNCIEGGVETIEHMYAATPYDVELLAKSSCFVSLTSGIFMDPGREAFLSPDNVSKTQKNRQRVIESLKLIMGAGIPFVIGTDAHHGNLYREVGFALELGADRKKALQGITSTAAKVCRREDRTGSLSAGYDADIIAVSGNPLEDVTVLCHVDLVMKGGIIYKDLRNLRQPYL